MLAFAAGGLFAMCRDEPKEPKPAPVKMPSSPLPKKIKRNREEVRAQVDELMEALAEGGEPRVVFGADPKGELYAVEQGLADCIQTEENTCYLSADFRRRFGTNLMCFANDWGGDALEISFGGSAPDGMSTVVRIPDGERMEYEQSPHPAIDSVAAGDFYTDICRDVLELLQKEPPVNPCIERPDSFECFDVEHSADWAFDFAPTVKDTFALLSENGFEMKDGGMNFFSIGFEALDGTRKSQTFFPKPAHCFEEYDLIPCWKFELQFGGEYTTDELLEKSFEMQETLDEEGEL